MEELSKTGSDLNNLLASTEIGTIFMDTSLNIRRFTPAATEFFSLLQTDIGRPVSHLASLMHYDRLVEDAKAVLKTLVPKEMEVETKQGRWFKMRILPYRTVENVIDGVVITFVDITQRREMEEKLRKAHGKLEEQVGERGDELRKSGIWFRGMFKILDEAVLLVTQSRVLEEINPAAGKMFGYKKEELAGKSTEILHVDHEHYVEFGEKLKEAFEKAEAAEFDFSAKRKNGEVFPTHHTVSLLTDHDGDTVGIVSVVRDMSEPKTS
jgi:PAS domain S-box-containing protein